MTQRRGLDLGGWGRSVKDTRLRYRNNEFTDSREGRIPRGSIRRRDGIKIPGVHPTCEICFGVLDLLQRIKKRFFTNSVRLNVYL